MCIKKFSELSSRTMLLGLTIICLGVYLTGYIMEHHVGVLACKMCHYERDIFLGAGALSLLSLIFLPHLLRQYAVLLLGLIFLGGALLAGYHVAVQQHWVALPSFCATNDFSAFESVEALREQLLKTPFVRCDQITWSLFGLSLAAYNTLLSLFLALLCWAWVWKHK